MKYFYATYETRDGEHEYTEAGVLTASNWLLAKQKAAKAKALYDRHGWEEFCQQDEIMEISKNEYGVLKKFIVNIDWYFDKEGVLRA